MTLLLEEFNPPKNVREGDLVREGFEDLGI
jgi:hypothetical protein